LSKEGKVPGLQFQLEQQPNCKFTCGQTLFDFLDFLPQAQKFTRIFSLGCPEHTGVMPCGWHI
jgi:hypothetical protein